MLFFHLEKNLEPFRGLELHNELLEDTDSIIQTIKEEDEQWVNNTLSWLNSYKLEFLFGIWQISF